MKLFLFTIAAFSFTASMFNYAHASSAIAHTMVNARSVTCTTGDSITPPNPDIELNVVERYYSSVFHASCNVTKVGGDVLCTEPSTGKSGVCKVASGILVLPTEMNAQVPHIFTDSLRDFRLLYCKVAGVDIKMARCSLQGLPYETVTLPAGDALGCIYGTDTHREDCPPRPNL